MILFVFLIYLVSGAAVTIQHFGWMWGTLITVGVLALFGWARWMGNRRMHRWEGP